MEGFRRAPMIGGGAGVSGSTGSVVFCVSAAPYMYASIGSGFLSLVKVDKLAISLNAILLCSSMMMFEGRMAE
jgi:hypothetical protein